MAVLQVFPVLGWAFSKFVLESVGKIVKIGIANSGGYRLYGKLLFLQKDLGSVHPQVGQVGHNGMARFRFEDPPNGCGGVGKLPA